MPPPIRFALTEDEVSIAYSVHGEGPPLVFVRGWIGHLDVQWLMPDYRLFMEALGRHFTVIRYDARGNGLSERNVAGRLTLDDLALDIHAVLDATNVDTATFLATCYGGPILARFAAQAPGAIARLLLDGTYAKGWELGTQEMRESVLSTVKLLQSQPGVASTMLSYYTDPDQHDRSKSTRNDQFGRDAINADAAGELYGLSFDLDVSKYYANIDAPTLVTHRRDSKSVPVALGRKVAALIPNATFVAIDGRPHNPWDGDATQVLQAMGTFLGVPLAHGYQPRVTVRPTVVLFSDIVGSTDTASRIGDTAAHEIVRVFHAITRQSVETRNGHLVKSMGDGVMVEFPSVSQALGCAVDMQLAFAASNTDHTDHTEQELAVRIGINAGEPVSEDDDLHGLVVSTASRVCDYGAGGDIIVSNVVRELAIGKGYTFEDRGSHELRGVGEAVHLFRVNY